MEPTQANVTGRECKRRGLCLAARRSRVASPQTRLWSADPSASSRSVARHLDIYGSIIVMIAFVLRAAATFVPGHVHEPGGVAVARMVRTMARVRSMSVQDAFAPLFTHFYSHVARLADFIAREPALAKRTGA
jgi:hypothetical protein